MGRKPMPEALRNIKCNTPVLRTLDEKGIIKALKSECDLGITI